MFHLSSPPQHHLPGDHSRLSIHTITSSTFLLVADIGCIHWLHSTIYCLTSKFILIIAHPSKNPSKKEGFILTHPPFPSPPQKKIKKIKKTLFTARVCFFSWLLPLQLLLSIIILLPQWICINSIPKNASRSSQ
jgi:hypothetical protein